MRYLAYKVYSANCYGEAQLSVIERRISEYRRSKKGKRAPLVLTLSIYS